MNICVVPSNRPAALKRWLEAWEPVADWDRLIVIYDGEFGTDLGDSLSHCDEAWDWCDIKKALAADSWIISRRDSAIRCFGFYRAWQLGAKYIGTLDDDCFPVEDQEWFEFHTTSMAVSRWESPVDNLPRVRGMPRSGAGCFSAVLNIGLWRNHADLDSISRLAVPDDRFYMPDNEWQRAIPCHQFMPMCGMNLCFRADFAPAMYFPLMGDGQPYRRFDDIWCGVIAKRIADHLRLSWTYGNPHVYHRQLSDPFDSLVAEAPGIRANETFWRWVMCGMITGETPAECMLSLAESLKDYCGEYPDAEYKLKLCEAMGVWAGLFTSVAATTPKSP